MPYTKVGWELRAECEKVGKKFPYYYYYERVSWVNEFVFFQLFFSFILSKFWSLMRNFVNVEHSWSKFLCCFCCCFLHLSSSAIDIYKKLIDIGILTDAVKNILIQTNFLFIQKASKKARFCTWKVMVACINRA